LPAIRSNFLPILRWFEPTSPIDFAQLWNWWGEVDCSGHPALRPSGAAPSARSGSLPAIRSNFLPIPRWFEPTSPIDFAQLWNWWREVDSNHRRRKPADLQSAPVGRLGIPP